MTSPISNGQRPIRAAQTCAACGDRTLIAGIGKQAGQPEETLFDPAPSEGQTPTVTDFGRMCSEVRQQVESI